ncbi:hypothetical protein ACA910_017370 [Epithemia clementina (nom. ined.)]
MPRTGEVQRHHRITRIRDQSNRERIQITRQRINTGQHHGPAGSGRRCTNHVPLTTTASNNDANDANTITGGPFRRAIQKFRQRPGTYLLIPCIAALVGWITNYMAVQMIFYPIQYWGIPLWRAEEVPLGLIGWQGIVPCKTRKMSQAMVHMVTSQLISVKEVFGRLDPKAVASILAPQVPQLVKEVVADTVPRKFMVGIPALIYNGMDSVAQTVLQKMNLQFLEGLVKSMQSNVDKIFSLENCVVSQMLQDRSVLGQLFRKCGQAELDFLTNSGLWFGFLLGIIQMIVALFWENPWTLSIGGAIVGTATNWLALKWIFSPVDPTPFGPFVLQGQFLKRQKEVSAEFSKFFANHILTSERLWNSLLTDPSTSPAFGELFRKHFTDFASRVSSSFRMNVDPELIRRSAEKALKRLPHHVPVIYPYMDRTLGLETTLRERMELMSSRQFERVLHPIFEEDELTLIIAGAVLGFIAGLIQQGLETGAIKIPKIRPFMKGALEKTGRVTKAVAASIGSLPGATVRFVKKLNRRARYSNSTNEGEKEE